MFRQGIRELKRIALLFRVIVYVLCHCAEWIIHVFYFQKAYPFSWYCFMSSFTSFRPTPTRYKPLTTSYLSRVIRSSHCAGNRTRYRVESVVNKSLCSVVPGGKTTVIPLS